MREIRELREEGKREREKVIGSLEGIRKEMEEMKREMEGGRRKGGKKRERNERKERIEFLENWRREG